MQNYQQGPVLKSANSGVQGNEDWKSYVSKLILKKKGINILVDNPKMDNLVNYLTEVFFKNSTNYTPEFLEKTVMSHIDELIKNNNPLISFLLPPLQSINQSNTSSQPSIPNQLFERKMNLKRMRRMDNFPPCLTFSENDLLFDNSEILSTSLDGFVIIYHELQHLSVCKRGCTIDCYCNDFKALLEHTKVCTPTLCYNPYCKLLRQAIIHISSCSSSTCSICKAGKEFHNKIEEKQYLQSHLLPSFFQTMNDVDIRSYINIIQLNSAPWWKQSNLRSEINKIINEIRAKDIDGLFHQPVDINMNGCLSYYQEIDYPMDLKTMENKNNHYLYHSIQAFHNDMILMFNNCRKFNNSLYIKNYSTQIEHAYNSLIIALHEHDKLLKEKYYNSCKHICCICNGGDYLLEGQTFHCNGDCHEIIEVDHTYYIDTASQHIWCESCYKKLEDVFTFEDQTIRKADLSCRKNKQTTKEGWITCEKCKQYYHQVCVLYNTKLHEQLPASIFYCPLCILQAHENNKNPFLPNILPTVEGLLECDLSRFIEARIYRMIMNQRKIQAKAKNCSIRSIPYPRQLSVRVVVNSTEKLAVDSSFLQYFKSVNFPSEILYHVKCICLFQKINKMDVLAFIMYVYECPENTISNYKSAYISYLDSVHFIEPSSFRKAIYQELVLSYIAYIKQQGFNTLHLWVCPPKKGDDYIIFSHPPEQKILTVDRLQKWYMEILYNGHQEGIIKEQTNMVDEYMTGKYNRGSTDDNCLLRIPRFSGDHWVLESEAKSKELLNQKHNDDVDSDTSTVTTTSITQSVGKRGRKKKGELLNAVYESIKDYKVRLLVVKLQHQCQVCGRFLAEENHFLLKNASILEKNIKRTGSKKTIEMLPYICANCLIKQPVEDRQVIEVIEAIHYDTSDPNPFVLSRVFENRQNFLSVCGSNHFQFDQLRRALYSTMMILYYCNDPSIYIYNHTCNECEENIVEGKRWHCPICFDYDLCEKCKNKHHHEHDLVPYDVSMSSHCKDNQLNILQTSSMDCQLLALLHCFSCETKMCGIPICPLMKASIHHYVSCKKTTCKLCKHMERLIVTHIKNCTDSLCKVPHHILQDRFPNVI